MICVSCLKQMRRGGECVACHQQAEIERLRIKLAWVARHVVRVKDWPVPGGVELVVDHIKGVAEKAAQGEKRCQN